MRDITLRSLALAVVVVLLTSPAAASDDRVALRGYGGYGTIAMGGPNSIIDQQNDLLSEGGFGRPFDEFRGGLIFGFDFLAPVTQQITLVLSYDRISQSLTHSLTSTEGFYRSEWAAEGDFFSGGILAFLKPGHPWYFIGKVGYGQGASELASALFQDQTQLETRGHDAEGSGIVVEVGLGGQRQFANEGSLFGFIEATYRYRNLGAFDGKGYINEVESKGTVGDATGNPIDFDFSGIAVKAGLGFSL